uniref:Uncharacterized protein n=1 Tax=Anopheles farauti TaxID=69004 RepID=A0A182QKA3_9DIPT
MQSELEPSSRSSCCNNPTNWGIVTTALACCLTFRPVPRRDCRAPPPRGVPPRVRRALPCARAGSDPADEEVADADTDVDDAYDTDDDDADEEDDEAAASEVSVAAIIRSVAGRFSSLARMEPPPAGGTNATPSEPLLIFSIILGESFTSAVPLVVVVIVEPAAPGPPIPPVGEWVALLFERGLPTLTPSSNGFALSPEKCIAPPPGVAASGGIIGFILSLGTLAADSVLMLSFATTAGGTLIVIFSACVCDEVVTETVAAADEIEDDETGDDSRELILVSLELLLSSPDCFVGGRIGLIVSFGTVGASVTIKPAPVPPPTPSTAAFEQFGIGLIVSFGIELELIFGSFGGSGSGLIVSFTPSELVRTGAGCPLPEGLQLLAPADVPGDKEDAAIDAIPPPSCGGIVLMCSFGIGGPLASALSAVSLTRKLL